jgi:glycosyltransferase involved in cell wall biosynthesis
MRIVHLTASTFFGGPERQMLGLTVALPPEFETHFVGFSEGGRSEEFFAVLADRGISGQVLPHDTPHFRSVLRDLTAELENHEAEVLIAHGYKSNILGRIAARRVGIPAISVSRGWTWENRKMQFYTWLDKRHLSWMDHVVCVSHGQAEKVLAAGVPSSRVTTIHNSSRLAAFEKLDPAGRQALREFFPPTVERIVLAAGRLSAEKGFEVLLSAAAKVLEQDSAVGFILFGEGDERASLEAQHAALKLGPRFVMPGFTKELDRYIPWADLVVLSSYTEGLPNVLLEASAAGVPIVATRVGGVPEVVEEGDSGYLVEPGDAEAMALRITQLLWDQNRREQMGQAGRLRMQEMFTFEAQARAYAELLMRIVPHARKVAYANAA